MTIIAGIVSRRDGDVPAPHCNALSAAISRWPSDAPIIYKGHGWWLGKVDIGALDERGDLASPEGSALVLAGEPLLASSSDESVQGRDADAGRLLASLNSGSIDALACATGAFCVAHYSPQSKALTLATDKLGIRPLYYTVTDEWVVFASALRILESLPFVNRSIHVRGVYEQLTFGFPLGDRTPYREICSLGPGQTARFADGAAVVRPYYRWDELQPRAASEEALVEQLVPAFRRAVSRRSRGDSAAISFLSGGLDSRAIVATLRGLGVSVHAVNFAPPDSQDRVFAQMAAAAMNCRYHQLEVPLSMAQDAHRKRQLVDWLERSAQPMAGMRRGRVIWSGDGGSVALGHVYLDPDAVEYFERGDIDRGIDAFLRYNHISGAANSALAGSFRARARTWHKEGVRREIDALAKPVTGRTLHLFLMLNDQRRHLAHHFENIDLDRIELHLPFFDSQFLELILSAPVAPFLRHRLYGAWLRALSPEAAGVPWQAYPNHEPCPVPFSGKLRYQWQRDYFDPAEDRKVVRRTAKAALGRLLTRDFPAHLIDRRRFGAAVALSLLGGTRGEHVLKVGDTFARYWQLAPSSADDSMHDAA
jgi:hypothetical protein